MRLPTSFIFTLAVIPAIAGCYSQREYVLQKPIDVLVPDGAHVMTVPAGAHVTQTGYHDGMAFIKVYGMTRHENLQSLAPVK